MTPNAIDENFRRALVNNITGHVTEVMLISAASSPKEVPAEQVAQRIAQMSSFILDAVIAEEQTRTSRVALEYVEGLLKMLQQLEAKKDMRRIPLLFPLFLQSAMQSSHGTVKAFAMALNEMGKSVQPATMDKDVLERIYALLEDARVSIRTELVTETDHQEVVDQAKAIAQPTNGATHEDTGTANPQPG